MSNNLFCSVLTEQGFTNLYWLPDFFHIVTIIDKPLVYCCYPSEIILFLIMTFEKDL